MAFLKLKKFKPIILFGWLLSNSLIFQIFVFNSFEQSPIVLQSFDKNTNAEITTNLHVVISNGLNLVAVAIINKKGTGYAHALG